MDDPNIAMLQYAAAVPSPLRLKVRTRDGKESVTEVDAPFALIGRSSDSDICLRERTVSFRHVYLQAIGSRLACIDLLSTTGTKWSGDAFHGWMGPGMSMTVGTTTIEVEDTLWQVDETLKPPLEFRPKEEVREEYGMLPKVELELLNTSAKGKRWPINRVVTLVGRDEKCRITIVDDRISKVHCGLLLLPSGLWVIDLLSKGGFKVNDQACRCAMLPEGTKLEIGPYQLAAHYPDLQAIPTPQPQTPSKKKSLSSSAEFLTRQNKIFQVEGYDDTLIVYPLGDSQSFFYQEIHVEASRVMELIKNRAYQRVVIDFGKVESVGHMILESLASFCRAAPKKAALCNASVETYQTLQTHTIHKIWAHYANQDDALTAVHLP